MTAQPPVVSEFDAPGVVFGQAPLRIAMIAPPWFDVPPRGYGGIERVVALLADGLADAGHDVTLFAPGGSNTRATLEPTFAQEHPELMGHSAVITENTVRAYRNWREFDVIHDHTIEGLAAAAAIPAPVVHTLHGPLLPEYRSLYRALPRNIHLVAISRNQQRTLPPECESTIIWNPVEVDSIEWSEQPGDYLLFVGRATPDKGPVEAAQIAEKAGKRLVMFLKVNEPPEHRYFELIQPLLQRAGVEVHLQATEAEKQAAYRGAQALLFPISWPEPFGLVMAESMAAGTPVIAFRQGAAPEVIDDGVTGFVVDDLEGAVEAVSRLPQLSRAACRERVERCFSPRTAIEQHLDVYARMVAHNKERAW